MFSALYSVLTSFDRVKEAIIIASENKNTPKITKNEFLRTARRLKRLEYTPLEAEYVFRIFDTDNDGRISLHDFETITYHDKFFEEAKKTKSFIQFVKTTILNFGLGSIAGATGAFAVYPIDLVKTRMQNQRFKAGAVKVYRNSFHCFYKVISTEGILGLYRGVLPQLVGVAPEKAIKLTVNDLLRSLFRKPGGEVDLPLEILAGMGAGASQVLFTNPLEIVKIRLQVQGEVSAQGLPRKSAISIIRELGFVGLYKGASACLLRDIPFSGIYFPAYANLKVYLGENGFTGWKLLFLAGVLAGVPAAYLCTPADVIKTRLQVQARAGQQTYHSIPDAFFKILKEEGFTAFWKGGLARVFRSSPQFGVTLLTYEVLLRNFAPDTVPRPPTNAPVNPVDYNKIFRGGVGRSLKREEERWGFLEKPEEDEKKKNNK
jgi:solute carrier family 25 aspartate/glutamate transporter 12/13